MDAAHHVVHDRADGDELLDGVDALVLQAQLAHHRELGVDQLLAEVPQVEMNDRSVRRFDRPTLLDFMHEGLGQPVPRSELHAAQHRRWLRLAQVVVLEVAVAVLVEQPATFSARRLGNEDARERKPGRVVLDELHVLERRTGAVGQAPCRRLCRCWRWW